ncbi:hypothetical protein ANO14919_116830 [Xylariales sp. No.14919]|nr:hypothetical protein ANO14919_116830 [Xylariales sp. No.14919]
MSGCVDDESLTDGLTDCVRNQLEHASSSAAAGAHTDVAATNSRLIRSPTLACATRGGIRLVVRTHGAWREGTQLGCLRLRSSSVINLT